MDEDYREYYREYYMGYYEIKNSGIELAFIDEGEEYSIDEYGIYYNPTAKKFFLLNASGCSCWDSDCDYTYNEFDSLEDLFIFLEITDNKYIPNFNQLQVLIENATKKATELKLITNIVKDNQLELSTSLSKNNKKIIIF